MEGPKATLALGSNYSKLQGPKKYVYVSSSPVIFSNISKDSTGVICDKYFWVMQDLIIHHGVDCMRDCISSKYKNPKATLALGTNEQYRMLQRNKNVYT